MAEKLKTSQLIQVVRDYTRPSPLKIPKKNPRLVYRFIRNTPENIALMEAKGYKIADSEIVRQAGLTPREDGTYRTGDLILAVEEYSHHAEHKEREAELRKRQQEAMQRGIRRRGRMGGAEVEETIKEE